MELFDRLIANPRFYKRKFANYSSWNLQIQKQKDP